MSNIEKTLEERGKVYGDFGDHAMMVEAIMDLLEDERDTELDPPGFETFLFYLISKIVRLNKSPLHKDTVHDIAGYATLWEEQVDKMNDMFAMQDDLYRPGDHLGQTYMEFDL